MELQAIKDMIAIISGLVTILAILIGSGATLFLFYQLAPVLNLKITPNWTDESKKYAIVKFEVENKSRVRVYNPIIKVQVVEQLIAKNGVLSEWVPFSQLSIRADEKPVKWQEPELMSPAKRIYSGETISIERLYQCPKKTMILHMALQVEINLGIFGRIVTGKSNHWSQVTTCFLVK